MIRAQRVEKSKFYIFKNIQPFKNISPKVHFEIQRNNEVIEYFKVRVTRFDAPSRNIETFYTFRKWS